MKPLHTLRVPPLEKALRLDQFLVKHFPQSSRAYWKERLTREVRLEGRKPGKGERVQGGELLEFFRPPPTSPPRLRANPAIPIRILYEDPDLLAVEKPAGLSCYPLREEEDDTLANGLAARFPELAKSTERPLEAGLLHRLDHETSGILMVARRQETATLFDAAAKRGEIRKYYLALVEGKLAGRGKIDFPIEHHPKNKKKMRVWMGEAPPPKHLQAATTEFRCLRSHATASWLLLTIRRGARHQIRAHLAALGHPILGDKLYARPKSDGSDQTPSPPRQMLHARSVSFAHPVSGKRLRIRSEMPKDFKDFLRYLKLVPERAPGNEEV